MSAPSTDAQETEAHDGVPQQVRLRMAKQAGDRSFGMTLEQRFAVTPHEYAAVVSYIFPDSPADRVSIKRGWMLLRINNRSVRGLPVKDVALMFRDLVEVDVEFETHSYSPLLMPLRGNFSATGGAFSSATANAFCGNLFLQASMAGFVPPPVPAPVVTGFAQPATHVPSFQQQPFAPTHFQAPSPAVKNAVPATSGHVILSPGSSLGVPASLAIPESATMAHVNARVVAAPAMPALNGHVPAPQQAVPQATSTAKTAVVREAISAVHSQSDSAPIIQKQAPPAAVLTRPQLPVPPLTASNEPLESVKLNAMVNSDPVAEESASSPHHQQTNGALSSASGSPSQPSETEAEPIAPAADVPAPAQEAAVTPVIISPTPTIRPTPQAPPAFVTEAKPSTPVASAPRAKQAKTSAAIPSTPVSVNRNAVTLKTEAHEVPPTTPAARVPQEYRKKRGRPTNSTSLFSSDNQDAVSQRARVKSRNRNAVPDDSDSDSSRHAYLHNDPESQSSPEQASTTTRRNTRRRGASGESTGRARTSLTVDRLMTMGFSREDANASVTACGHDPEACMIWIISHIEEKQFLDDLNKASVQSELSKQAEAKELKEQEKETYRKAKEFTALFTTSFMLSSESDATLFKKMLADAIGEVDPDTFLRVVLTKLLKLEAQAIRWYKDASKCYLLQLAQRLEASFEGHDVVLCCSKLPATSDSSSSPDAGGCAFLQTLHEEERSLSKALFDMPENHGGVPLAFLKADKDMQFSLDDDGFEVLEVEVTSD